jgi:hypothetical protein
MASTTTIRHGRTNRQNPPQMAKPPAAALDHAVRIIHAICGLAGSPSLIDDIRADLTSDKVRGAIRRRDTAAVFDWLLVALSYQGISDQVAHDYMEKHGRAAWRDIDQKLAAVLVAPSSRATGISMAAGTTRPAGPVPSLITLPAARCRAMTCAMVTSTRPPTPCSCSSATLPTAI